jgi:hypothetical protein
LHLVCIQYVAPHLAAMRCHCGSPYCADNAELLTEEQFAALLLEAQEAGVFDADGDVDMAPGLGL